MTFFSDVSRSRTIAIQLLNLHGDLLTPLPSIARPFRDKADELVLRSPPLAPFRERFGLTLCPFRIIHVLIEQDNRTRNDPAPIGVQNEFRRGIKITIDMEECNRLGVLRRKSAAVTLNQPLISSALGESRAANRA